MSYYVEFQKVYGVYGEEGGYHFSWPHEIEEGTQKMITKILYDYNKASLILEEKNSNSSFLDFVKNTYFFVYPEGAVMFTINKAHGKASLKGIYVKPEYILTVWLILDKLSYFIHSYDFKDDSNIVYEKDLDKMLASSKNDDKVSDHLGENKVHSFAISSINPKIIGVTHYSNMETSLDKVISADCFRNKKKLEEILNSKGTLRNSSVDAYIEYNAQKNLKEFLPWNKRSSNWILRIKKPVFHGEDKEVFIDDEMQFSRLVSMTKS